MKDLKQEVTVLGLGDMGGKLAKCSTGKRI